MKKKVILHIGCEKTGTTSIQNTLDANRAVLSEKFDILYPSTLGKHGNHTSIAIYACNDDKKLTRFLPKQQSLDAFRKQVRQALLEEVNASTASQVLISCEWLHPRVIEKEEFGRLKSLLNEISDNIEIIVYLRRQDLLAMSLYSTALKSGHFSSFTFPKIRDGGKLPYYYDFLSIYRNWKKFFGAENIVIKNFDRKKLHNQDVISDFFQLLSIETDGIDIHRESNRGLSSTGISVLKGVNKIINSIPKRISPKPKYIRYIRQIISKKFEGKTRLATDDECKAFSKHFERNNRQLEIEYKNDTNRTIQLF